MKYLKKSLEKLKNNSVIKKIFLISFLILLNHILFSQNPKDSLNPKTNNFKKNAVFGEIGGQGGVGSINYERAIIKKKNFSLNGSIGISYLHEFIFPTRLSVSFYCFEIGVGTFSILYNFKGPFYTYSYFMYYFNQPFIGFRYQNKKKFLYRVTFTPMLYAKVEDEDSFHPHFSPWFGFSFGYCFNFKKS